MANTAEFVNNGLGADKGRSEAELDQNRIHQSLGESRCDTLNPGHLESEDGARRW